MKTLRLDRNNLTLDVIPGSLLKESNLSLLSYDGNRFDEKAFQGKEGYDQVDIDHQHENETFLYFFSFSICSVLQPVDENWNEFFFGLFLLACLSHFSNCFILY